MRIVLVKPPFARSLSNSVYLTFPLGAMCVAGMLKQRGHEVLIYHDDVSAPGTIPSAPVRLGLIPQASHDESIYAPLVRVLEEFRPDAVGVSYCTADAEAALDVARLCRTRRIRTVAGGVHPSLLPEEAICVFDAVVVGEGDEPMAAVAFEGGDGIVETRPVEDLDAVVADRTCVIGGEKYSNLLRGLVQTQRGCPYGCSYCAAPTIFGKRVRLRDPGAVREEVESLKTPVGRIIDDSFGVVKSHALKVCEELGKLKFQWVCDAALQNIDEAFVDALLRGGCRCVNVGLESASERWRELSGKRVAEGEPERVLKMCLSKGLNFVAYLMVGFPGETVQELEATLRWGHSLKAEGAKPHISIAVPYVGTKLHSLVRLTHSLPSNWSAYFHQSGAIRLADCSDSEWGEVLRCAEAINA